MPYPCRPVLEVLPEFAGTASVRQTPEQRGRLLAFCAEQYAVGRSIHELAELTGRTQSAVRRALDQGGVQRRGRGARRVRD
ncbi:helix-turn-helix domain-containing protein [Terrabacter sp. NPDC080008]|uniref:helix-turn-helix domain-containing protein n=1 Tax=Terrabacter sp. NPDC080008 TaxID=3155176 RepID=UPI0034509030